ncbi:MAG TPA: hypothetical protein VGE12_18345 [Noviherbaspirillum sp.]
MTFFQNDMPALDHDTALNPSHPARMVHAVRPTNAASAGKSKKQSLI